MFRSSFLYLGIFAIFISIFSILNILFCYYFNSLLNVSVYFYSLLISTILSIVLIYFNKSYFSEKIFFFEKILLVIVGFFYLPLLIAIPYYLSIYNISFVNSYFEAISGFTSTGFTIFNNTKEIDEPLLIWRSISQWLGGLYFIYSLFLLADSSKIKNIYSNLAAANFIEIKKQYTKVLIIYFLLTALIFVLLSFSGIRLFESLNLSMTIISAGGFLPSNSLNEIIRLESQTIVFSLCMLIPFFNLYLIYNIFSGKRSLDINLQDLYLLAFLLSVLFFFYIFFNKEYDLSLILFSVISSLSNIGIGLNSDFSKLSILLLILVIIGGSTFSTSSGLKFIKLYTLIKFSLNEIYLIVKPLHVSGNTLFLSKSKVNDEEIKNYFLIVIFFISCLFLLSAILSFENISFQNIFSLSILTITNTVNSSNYELTDFYFVDLNIFSKYSLIIFMIIGRVELLSFLILIKKFFTK